MNLGTDLIILDLEISGDDIIEIGAVRFDRNGNISQDVFQSLVNSKKQLASCFVKGKGQISITELTGINWKDVQKADSFKEVMKRFTEWCFKGGTNLYLSAWGGDVPYLREQCKKHDIEYSFRGSSYDIKSFVVIHSAFHGIKFKTTGLKTMMSNWGLKWDNTYGEQHRATADSYNTALLLEKCLYEHNLSVSSIKRIYQKLGGK